jgi:hypothetical protein
MLPRDILFEKKKKERYFDIQDSRNCDVVGFDPVPSGKYLQLQGHAIQQNHFTLMNKVPRPFEMSVKTQRTIQRRISAVLDL